MISVNYRRQGDICILDITGVLDRDGAKMFKEAMERARKTVGTKILLNFNAVSNVQSAVLQSLLTSIRVPITIGGAVGIFGMSNGVKRTIEKSSFYPLIQVFEDEKQALNGLTTELKKA